MFVIILLCNKGHQSSEVVRGGGEGAESEKESRRRDQKEMTPLVEIEGGGRESETRKQTSSPSDNVSHTDPAINSAPIMLVCGALCSCIYVLGIKEAI